MAQKVKILVCLLLLILSAISCSRLAPTHRPVLAATARTINVTSLGDSGTGTLRACMQATGPRVCFFKTGGSIRIKTPIIVTSGDLVVNGSNAPKLVEVKGAGIRIHGSNVSISNIAVRPGALYTDSKTFDGIVLWSKGTLTNVTLSHLSLTWAVDENFSTYGPNISNVRVDHCIIAEGLHCSIHPEGCHSKGALIDRGARNFLFYRNLFAHNHDRNIRMKSDVRLSFVNNLVYGWGGTSTWNYLNFTDNKLLPPTWVDFIGNLYKRAPLSTGLKVIYSDTNIPTASRVYTLGNITPTRTLSSQDEWLVSALPTSFRSLTPLGNVEQLEITPIADLPEYMRLNVGPNPTRRSRTDTRIVTEVLNGTGGIKDCVTGCTRHAGGWDQL